MSKYYHQKPPISHKLTFWMGKLLVHAVDMPATGLKLRILIAEALPDNTIVQAITRHTSTFEIQRCITSKRLSRPLLPEVTSSLKW